MPWTIRELADAAGVTKKTIRDRLKREELWDWHVSKGADGRCIVDDEAGQIVLARYPAKVKAKTAESAEAEAVRRDYEAKLSDMRTEYRRKQMEIANLNNRIDELGRELDDKNREIKRLPAPDAVDRAREEGERAGMEAGEEKGRTSEREKIANMGFWARRRYLRGSRSDG